MLLVSLPVATGPQPSRADPLPKTDRNPPPAAPAEQDETEILRAVVRVHWELIDALADEQIKADVPFAGQVSDGQMRGRVTSRADLTVQLEDREGAAMFRVQARGRATGRFQADSGVFRISGPIAVPFEAEQMVHFDGRRFTMDRPTVSARVQAEFQCIGTRRNRLPGRIVSRMASRPIHNSRPEAEREARPTAERYLRQFVEDETAVLAERLNRVTPIEASLLRVYPQLKDWKVQLSSNQEYLEARYAPSGELIQLPDDPQRPRRTGLEIWIRTTEAEAKFIERIGAWTKTQEALQEYLQNDNREVARMTSQIRFIALDNWVVVAIGALPPAGDEDPAPSSRDP